MSNVLNIEDFMGKPQKEEPAPRPYDQFKGDIERETPEDIARFKEQLSNLPEEVAKNFVEVDGAMMVNSDFIRKIVSSAVMDIFALSVMGHVPDNEMERFLTLTEVVISELDHPTAAYGLNDATLAVMGNHKELMAKYAPKA